MSSVFIFFTLSCLVGTLATPTKNRHSNPSGLTLPQYPQPSIFSPRVQDKMTAFQKVLKASTENTETCVERQRSASLKATSTCQQQRKAKQRSTQDRINILRKVWAGKDAPNTVGAAINIMEQMASPLYQCATDCSNFLCPTASSVDPCTCDPCTRTINCSGLTNFTQLHNIFHSTFFPTKQFCTFLMDNDMSTASSDESVILDNTFGPVSFEAIHIANTAVEEVMQNAFTNSEQTLVSLVFSWNYYMHTFPFSQLSNYVNLERVEVTACMINQIPDLGEMPQLKLLYLNQNHITNITTRTLANSPHLQVVDLGFNCFQTLEKDDFYLSSQMSFLYLDHNQINHIEPFTFNNMMPFYLDLSYNYLHTLEETVFEPILQSMIMAGHKESLINVENNPLCCSTLSWLLSDPLYIQYFILPDPNCMW